MERGGKVERMITCFGSMVENSRACRYCHLKCESEKIVGEIGLWEECRIETIKRHSPSEFKKILQLEKIIIRGCPFHATQKEGEEIIYYCRLKFEQEIKPANCLHSGGCLEPVVA